MTNPISTVRIAAQGVGITCYVAGEGPTTIMLLHGAGVDSALLSWREVIPILAKEYRVIAPDLPGYGASERIAGEYSLQFYTESVKSVIEYFDSAPVVVVGLSLGGGIALSLALRYPGLLHRLVAVDAWGFFAKLPWHRTTYWFTRSWLNRNLYAWTAKWRSVIRWSLRENLFGDESLITDDLITEVQQAMLQPGAGDPFISFQQSEITPIGFTTDLFGRLEEIATPTLIVHGSLDRAVPFAGAIEASKRIPDCDLYVMEGCKHWPQKERPEEFSRALLSWLEKRT